MKKLIKKIFGGITITWPKLIIFAILMGAWTALMAMLVPDGNSFHDIAVTGEWWMLPTLFIVLNSKNLWRRPPRRSYSSLFRNHSSILSRFHLVIWAGGYSAITNIGL